MPAPLPAHAAPGKVLAGRYALTSILGRGGMGVVMEAQHLTLGKRVAVKLLLSEADVKTRARFQLEARAAAQITSPHVAQVLDFGFTEDGLAFLVMEYLEGRDLSAEKKQRGKLPIAEAVDVVVEAMVGIAHAHAAGLVHRDIKPANIFLATIAGQRTVKVLDFGLIKVMDDSAALTNSTETFGTPKYMAPEQLRAARDVDERSDQHALASVLFELITGRAPFDGDSIPDIIVKVCTQSAPLMWSLGVSVPQPLDDSLQRALMKKPDDRFPSLAEFAFSIAPFGTVKAMDRAEAIKLSLSSATANGRVRGSSFADLKTTLPYAAPQTPSIESEDLVGTVQPASVSRMEVSSGMIAPSMAVMSMAAVGNENPTAPVSLHAGPPPAVSRALPYAPSVRGDDFGPPIHESGTLSAGSLATMQPPVARTTNKTPLFLAAAVGVAIAMTVFFVFERRVTDHLQKSLGASPTQQIATTQGPLSLPAPTDKPSSPVVESAEPRVSALVSPSSVAATSEPVDDKRKPGHALPVAHGLPGQRPTATPTPPTAAPVCTSLNCL